MTISPTCATSSNKWLTNKCSRLSPSGWAELTLCRNRARWPACRSKTIWIQSSKLWSELSSNFVLKFRSRSSCLTHCLRSSTLRVNRCFSQRSWSLTYCRGISRTALSMRRSCQSKSWNIIRNITVSPTPSCKAASEVNLSRLRSPPQRTLKRSWSILDLTVVARNTSWSWLITVDSMGWRVLWCTCVWIAMESRGLYRHWLSWKTSTWTRLRMKLWESQWCRGRTSKLWTQCQPITTIESYLKDRRAT